LPFALRHSTRSRNPVNRAGAFSESRDGRLSPQDETFQLLFYSTGVESCRGGGANRWKENPSMSGPEQKGSGRRVEQQAVRTTIVGGRPPGAGKPLGGVPRGVEVLIKKAAVDPQFRQLLLEQRAEAAKTIGLELRPSEIAMLAGIPQAQLEAIISRTKVDAKLRPILMGAAAAVMLVALGAELVVGEGCDQAKGSRPDKPPSAAESATENTTATTAPNPATTPGAAADTDAVNNPKRPTNFGGVRPDRPPPTTPPDTDAAVTPEPPPKPPIVVTGMRPDQP
jgi:hypothetical protein